jgi:hypothetical protein
MRHVVHTTGRLQAGVISAAILIKACSCLQLYSVRCLALAQRMARVAMLAT